MLRLFFAIDPDPASRRRLGVLLERFAGELSSVLGTSTRISWMRETQLHLTLKFLGDVDPRALDAVMRGAAESLREAHPFEVELAGLGSFPAVPAGAQVLWLDVRKGRDEIVARMRGLDEVLGREGFVPESRDPHPHLTVARVKSDRLRLPPGLGARLTEELGPIRFCATEVMLYRSHRSASGSAYEIMNRWPLPS